MSTGNVIDDKLPALATEVPSLSTMTSEDKLTIKCGTHGIRVLAVVFGHVLGLRDCVLGFVENSSDPDDLQAWCDECEQMFLQEQALTADFQKFNGRMIVCDFCYATLKEHHTKPD